MGKVELKPCPFCGNEEDFDYGFAYSTKFTKAYLYVGCPKCGAMMVDTNEDHCLKDVKIAWNKRAGEQE